MNNVVEILEKAENLLILNLDDRDRARLLGIRTLCQLTLEGEGIYAPITKMRDEVNDILQRKVFNKKTDDVSHQID